MGKFVKNIHKHYSNVTKGKYGNYYVTDHTDRNIFIYKKQVYGVSSVMCNYLLILYKSTSVNSVNHIVLGSDDKIYHGFNSDSFKTEALLESEVIRITTEKTVEKIGNKIDELLELLS